jgi:hypothetical protein
MTSLLLDMELPSLPVQQQMTAAVLLPEGKEMMRLSRVFYYLAERT